MEKVYMCNNLRIYKCVGFFVCLFLREGERGRREGERGGEREREEKNPQQPIDLLFIGGFLHVC